MPITDKPHLFDDVELVHSPARQPRGRHPAKGPTQMIGPSSMRESEQAHVPPVSHATGGSQSGLKYFGWAPRSGRVGRSQEFRRRRDTARWGKQMNHQWINEPKESRFLILDFGFGTRSVTL
eukprot:7281590-Pyramimonas_sp.AAC.1